MSERVERTVLVEHISTLLSYADTSEVIRNRGSMYVSYRDAGVYVEEDHWNSLLWYQEMELIKIVDLIPHQKVAENKYEMKKDSIKKALEREYLNGVVECVLYGDEKVDRGEVKKEEIKEYTKGLKELIEDINWVDRKGVLEDRLVDKIDRYINKPKIEGLREEVTKAIEEMEYYYGKRSKIKLSRREVLKMVQKRVRGLEKRYGTVDGL